ncbi:MAG TPA: xanthine dehydrogenase family protein molybdopterin-binding subunit [Longimicrobiales bacterium]
MRPEELLPRQARTAVSAEELDELIAQEFRVLGKRRSRVDGFAKSTGSAVYADDIRLPGMLHAKILRSTHPHARIRSIDASKALELEGVHAVTTGADMPVQYCVIPWTRDEEPLAVERVRYIGDGVAAVAAIDEDTANRALRLIDVDYEPLFAYLDPEQSLNPPAGAPFIHEPKKAGHNGNITKMVKLAFGDVDAQLAASDVVIEGEYFFEGTTHTPIEPHCAIGWYGPDGKLTVWSSTQVPHYLHRELARVFDLDVARIRVVQPAVGGAFGGKSEPFDLEFCVAALSMKTGRPVKILYTREEVFLSHRGRHPMKMRSRLGASRDGKILAVDNQNLLDGGAYASFGLVTAYYSGQLLTAPYDFGSYRFHATRVYTNKPACGPKRGHGSVQPRFGFEVQLDKLAETVKVDPIELRRRNFLAAPARTINGLRVRSNGFLECLDAVERASGWKKKFRQMPYGRGVGVAGSCYISGTNYPIYPNDMPQSAVQIAVERSGRVTIWTGASEIGQGSDSVVAYITAEELGIPLEYVRVISTDTDAVPVDLGAYSSRETFMVGNACIQAAQRVKRMLQEAVAAKWETTANAIGLAGGWAFDTRDTARRMLVTEAINLAEAKSGPIVSVGSYNTPKDVHGDYRGGTIGASPAYSFTAHIAEVDVEPETGIVRVEKIWVAHDCGRALNPVLVEGQIEGSAYMGFAEALMEAQIFKNADQGREGLLHAASLLDYRIPTSLDTPELEALIVESVDPEGPYGAKEAGEGPLHPSIPAIANAIFDATGARIDRIPFDPPRVWRALQNEQARARWAACRANP